MHKKIPPELLFSSEQQLLAGDEKNILRRQRDKKFLFIIGTYLALIGVLIEAWFQGHKDSIRRGPEELERFMNVSFYFIGFCFIILTIYFINYYFKSVSPIIKDLKNGTKVIIPFLPGKYQTPFFAEYYLKTILQDRPLIKIDKELYDFIQDTSHAFISISPYSEFVFSIQIDDRKMKFNYSTLVDDI